MTQRSEGFEAKVLLAAIVVTIVALPAGALALRQSTANSSRIPISLLDDDVSADQDRGDTTDSAETTNEGGDVSDSRSGGDDDANSGFGHGGVKEEDDSGSRRGADDNSGSGSDGEDCSEMNDDDSGQGWREDVCSGGHSCSRGNGSGTRAGWSKTGAREALRLQLRLVINVAVAFEG